MTGGQQDADIEREITELAGQMETLAAQKAAVEKRARELMAAEDPKAGVFYAQEIFAAKQEKLTVETQYEIVRRRRNRLLAGQ